MSGSGGCGGGGVARGNGEKGVNRTTDSRRRSLFMFSFRTLQIFQLICVRLFWKNTGGRVVVIVSVFFVI